LLEEGLVQMASSIFPLLQDEDPMRKKLPVPDAPTPGALTMPTMAPPSPIASALPKIGAPAARQSEYDRLTDPSQESHKAGWQQIKNPFLRGLAGVAQTIGSIAAPGITSMIPGTSLHHQALVNQSRGEVNQDVSEQQKQAQTSQENATAAHLNQETSDLQNPTPDEPKNEFALWHQQNPQGTAEDFMKLQDAHKPEQKSVIHETDQGIFLVDPVTKQATPLTFNGQPLKPKQAAGNFEEQSFQEWKQSHPTGTRMQFEAERSRNTQKPEKEPQTLAVIDGKVVSLKPGMAVPEGTTSLAGDLKPKQPSADEQRRADLANNMTENLNALEEIVKRRPELFGPIAGRMTEARASFGTSDPDVAKLKAIEEFMGMAAVGTHAMRNAQHVETAAHAITNGFKNDANSVMAAIKQARDSIQTFKNDVNKGPNAQPQATHVYNPATGKIEAINAN
jgi:hypothetical protein